MLEIKLEVELDRVDVVVGMDEEVSTNNGVGEVVGVVVVVGIKLVAAGIKLEVVGTAGIEVGVSTDIEVEEDTGTVSASTANDEAGSVAVCNESEEIPSVDELIVDN